MKKNSYRFLYSKVSDNTNQTLFYALKQLIILSRTK